MLLSQTQVGANQCHRRGRNRQNGMCSQDGEIEIVYPDRGVGILLGEVRRLTALDDQMIVQIGAEENRRDDDRAEHADHVQADQTLADEDESQHNQDRDCCH